MSEKQDLENRTPIVERSLGVHTLSEENSSIKGVKLSQKEIWRKKWDQAVRQGWWPRVLYAAFGLVVGAIWIGITIYFSNSEKKWSVNQEKQKLWEDSRGRQVATVFDGSLKQFDQDAKTLIVTWSAIFINFPDPSDPSKYVEYPLNYPDSGKPSYRYPIDVYRDVDTTYINGSFSYPVDSNSIKTTYYDAWVVWNSSNVPPMATVGITADDTFDTDIEFRSTDNAGVWRQPLFGYPLDQMAGNIQFVTSYSPYLKPLLPDGFTTRVFNFSDARLTDYSFNWRFHISTESICLSPRDFPELGPAVNDSLSYLSFPCHLAINLTATRPPLVQFAVVMAVIVNWTSTLFIFVLTCESLLMRREWMLSGTDLFGITFTALFALPTVRSLLPGAPDFGVLNLIGIIPNVIVISLCIVAIAVAKLSRKQHKENTKNKDD